jgi:ubiquinone/menaquinone biosynthesis C-methylase UbiE
VIFEDDDVIGNGRMNREPAREHPPDVGLTKKPWRWQERALQWLDFPLGRFLDYGCGPCALLEKVCDRCDECHGVDVDARKLEEARRRFPHFKRSHVGLDGATDYPDEYFDTVALIEVIEHVADERATLAEITRILKPGGSLLLTTPHAGLLTFLDLGNFKFVFPRWHRFIHTRVLRNREYYERRFEEGREAGLAGDVSVSSHRPPWHRHYKPRQITRCCPSSLQAVRQEVYFPGMRAFMLLRAMFQVCTGGLIRALPPPLSTIERGLSRSTSRAGDQLVILFQRQEPG